MGCRRRPCQCWGCGLPPPPLPVPARRWGCRVPGLWQRGCQSAQPGTSTALNRNLLPRLARRRAINWANLARKEKKEKKLAITVFSFPPDKGNVGTAAYLNVSAMRSQ